MRLAIVMALAMFVATPIVQLVAERDAAAQLWKPRSKSKKKAATPPKGGADAKAKTSGKSSRKAKAKAPKRTKKQSAAKARAKAKQAKRTQADAADTGDDFAIYEEVGGDLD
jgi:hypothetical protein